MRHTYECATHMNAKHIWMRNTYECATHTNEPCHTYGSVVSHMWMIRTKHTHDSCRMQAGDVSHIRMGHTTHTKQPIWIGHTTHIQPSCECIIPTYECTTHINAPHIWLRHTYDHTHAHSNGNDSYPHIRKWRVAHSSTSNYIHETTNSNESYHIHVTANANCRSISAKGPLIMRALLRKMTSMSPDMYCEWFLLRIGMRYAATHCNTLQHTATHCNTLQHSASHCNTLQNTAKYGSTL